MSTAFRRLFRSLFPNRTPVLRAPVRRRMTVESLEDRTVPTVTVLVDPVTSTLTLTGNGKNEIVSILETAGTTSINIDNNGDGGLDQFLDSYVFMGGIRSFNHININLGGGNDRIEFRAMHDIPTLRDFQITDTKGDNSFLFDANGFAISGRLNIQYIGGNGADTITTQLNAINATDVTLGVDAGAGNNQFSLLLRGAATDSSLAVNQKGAGGVDGANIFVQPSAIFVDSQFAVTFDGGSGNDGFNTSINSARITGGSTMNFQANMGAGADVLNYRLNSAMADPGSSGSAALHGTLGDGNDTFTSTLGYDAGYVGAGS